MTNLIEQAINCNDGDLAAKMIRDALGIESDDVANYCFPKEWPANREQRAFMAIGYKLRRGIWVDEHSPLPTNLIWIKATWARVMQDDWVQFARGGVLRYANSSDCRYCLGINCICGLDCLLGL